MSTYERVYRAVAEARGARWGYDRTLDPESYERWIEGQVADLNLREDADAAIHAWARTEL